MQPQRLNKSKFQIPESVVEDILSKLPVKSLLRFRCVCKPWYLSLQTPQFIAQHHRNNLENNNLNLLVKLCREKPAAADVIYLSVLSVQQEENYFVSENIDLPFYYEKFNVVTVVCGPCNGVFCLEGYEELALWNPSTREFKILPKSTVERPQDADLAIFGCLGFGFDFKMGDYKVVRFFTNHYAGEDGWGYWSPQIELYSLKSDSWKEIHFLESSPHTSHLLNHDLNGFFYWEIGLNISNGHILSFDMANEEFSIFPLPKFDESLGGYEWHLLDFNGTLGAIVYSWEVPDKSMDIWVMNDGTWTKQLSIAAIPGVEKPLGLWKNGRMFFENSSNELVLFDPITRESKNLGIHSYKGIMQLITYAESLVPINGRSEEEDGVIRQQVGI